MAPAAPPAKAGNLFTRKIGPLPMWAWTGIILVPVVIYGVIEHKKSASSSSASTDASDQTDASQVPQFVNQVYTNPTPPSAPGTPAQAGPTEAQFQAVAKSAETSAAVNRSQTTAIKDLKTDQKSDVKKPAAKKDTDKKKAAPAPKTTTSHAGPVHVKSPLHHAAKKK
jgi:hypothetical protein